MRKNALYHERFVPQEILQEGGVYSLCVRKWEVHHELWSESSVLHTSKAQSSLNSYKEMGHKDTPGASGMLRIELASVLSPQSFTYLLVFSPNLVGAVFSFSKEFSFSQLLRVSGNVECIS